MSTKAGSPDLTEARQHNEAVAYGKLLAVREILEALREDRPGRSAWVLSRGGDYMVWEQSWRGDYLRGYDRAVQVVKAMRLGVEKP